LIEDIEGATADPPRRRHVAVLSAAVAAAALALLLALVVPPSRDAAVTQSPAVPSARAGFEVTVASDPMRNVFVDMSRTSRCPDGSLLAPHYWVSIDTSSGGAYAVSPESRTSRSAPSPLVVDPRSGRPVVWSSAGTSRSVPVTFVYDRESRYIVTCVSPNTLAPREGSIPE
jgi:hypothetical protein